MAEVFKNGNIQIEFEKYGSGAATILAFHGFGRSFRDFESLATELGNDFCVLGCNLFLHGRSTIPQEMIDVNPITKIELVDFYSSFLKAQRIERFSLCGYSLGGNIALSLYEQLHLRVDNLILFAPDGIRKNRWYHLVSRNRIGRTIYRWVVLRPQFFFAVVKAATKLRILSKRMKFFLMEHMSSEEKRQMVYNVWNTFRNIDVDIALVCEKINALKTNAHFVFGVHDRVIKPSIGKSIAERLNDKSQVHFVQHGHHLLDRLIYMEIGLQELMSNKTSNIPAEQG